MTSIEDRLPGRWRWAFVPGGIAFGLAFVWLFHWTAHPVVLVAAVLVAVWQLVVGRAKSFLAPLSLSLVILVLGYGTVWNINYLAGHLLSAEALRDQELLDFDIDLYRTWFCYEGAPLGYSPSSARAGRGSFLNMPT